MLIVSIHFSVTNHPGTREKGATKGGWAEWRVTIGIGREVRERTYGVVVCVSEFTTTGGAKVIRAFTAGDRVARVSANITSATSSTGFLLEWI